MTNNFSDISHPTFRNAVEAIYKGDVPRLRQLLEQNPVLLTTRLDTPADGYFSNPYLLWFVADNPIREGKLPANSVEVTSLIIDAIRQHAPATLPEQLNYTLTLVASGRTPRECGVQIKLIDLLVASGASPDPEPALIHGNLEAAAHLVTISGKLNLTAAVCLDRMHEVTTLLSTATAEEKQVALMAAAFYGKAPMISLLIRSGVDVNMFITGGFHKHASPLHQAVSARSMESVRLLVEAGAVLKTRDNMYDGTPLDWAMHLKDVTEDEAGKEKYASIARYLSDQPTKIEE